MRIVCPEFYPAEHFELAGLQEVIDDLRPVVTDVRHVGSDRRHSGDTRWNLGDDWRVAPYGGDCDRAEVVAQVVDMPTEVEKHHDDPYG